jgi:hypothetical protein
MDLDDESDSENSSDATMDFSDDTTQCLIDSLAMQVRDLQLEREAMREDANKLINKLRTYECIIKSDILEKIFRYL